MSATFTRRLLVESVEGVTVVNFVDAALTSEEVIQQLEEQLLALTDQAGVKKLLLSFRDVQLMSSAVLAVLLKVSRRVTQAGGRLRLCGLAPGLRDVFRITRLDRVFEIHDAEAAALDSF
jgi:anti-sigma B factor antagonist